MKKIFALCLSLTMLMAVLTGCTRTEPVVTPTPDVTVEPTETPEPSMMPDVDDGIIDGDEEDGGIVDDDNDGMLHDEFEMEPDVKDDMRETPEVESDIMK